MAGLNTVVVGSSKTGTTGLYSAVWEGLSAASGGNCYGLPEKDDLDLVRSLQRLAPDRVLAAKFLLTSVDFSDELLEAFDKRLMTVRDPRDTLLSVALFYPTKAFNAGVDEGRIEEFVDLVRKKEQDPASVDFLEIFSAVRVLMGNKNPSRVPLRRFRVAVEHADHHDPRIVQYERFVRDDLGDVSDYLGFPIRNVRPTGASSFVFRSGGQGEWRDWFTERDVELLRPKLRPYMERFGYADDWELSSEPHLDPAYGSEYVRSSVAKRRNQVALSRGEGEVAERIHHLRELSEAGGVRSARRLAAILEEQDAEANAEEIRTQLTFAASGGDLPAMDHLARHLGIGPASVRDPNHARRWQLEAASCRERARALREAHREAARLEHTRAQLERTRTQLRRTRQELVRVRRSKRVRLASTVADAARGGPRAWVRLPKRVGTIVRS